MEKGWSESPCLFTSISGKSTLRCSWPPTINKRQGLHSPPKGEGGILMLRLHTCPASPWQGRRAQVNIIGETLNQVFPTSPLALPSTFSNSLRPQPKQTNKAKMLLRLRPLYSQLKTTVFTFTQLAFKSKNSPEICGTELSGVKLNTEGSREQTRNAIKQMRNTMLFTNGHQNGVFPSNNFLGADFDSIIKWRIKEIPPSLPRPSLSSFNPDQDTSKQNHKRLCIYVDFLKWCQFLGLFPTSFKFSTSTLTQCHGPAPRRSMFFTLSEEKLKPHSWWHIITYEGFARQKHK